MTINTHTHLALSVGNMMRSSNTWRSSRPLIMIYLITLFSLHRPTLYREDVIWLWIDNWKCLKWSWFISWLIPDSTANNWKKSWKICRQDIRAPDLYSNRRPLSIFQSTGLNIVDIESEVLAFEPRCGQRAFLFTVPDTDFRIPSLIVKWYISVVFHVQIPAFLIEISIILLGL
jgi:hypothetical protein